MNKIRIIPRLDIKGPNLVKGIHLEGLRVLGKPENFAKYYYENGADELFFQDTVASLYDRNSLDEIISKTAKEIFIPLTVGGGIRNINDIKKVLRMGADKVSINTAAIKDYNFIQEAALKFGSSTIVVAIEAIKSSKGEYLAYTDNGREHSGLNVFEWAMKAESLGAGEIIITSVDKEGTGEGFDIELIKTLASTLSIPLIAHGGCGSKEDVLKTIKMTNVEAISISSAFHYKFIKSQTENNDVYNSEGNVSFLNSGKSFNKIKSFTLKEVKDYLHYNEIPVRIF